VNCPFPHPAAGHATEAFGSDRNPAIGNGRAGEIVVNITPKYLTLQYLLTLLRLATRTFSGKLTISGNAG
jgi:hypothetical protein